MTTPTPLTVIGGFLGAGKTTLLNRVLAESEGVRYAVLVNDFGALAIDGALVREHGGDTITFANGCVCCSLGDSMLESVDRLLAGRQAPDQFLVEASGVADPRGIIDLAVLHPDLRPDLTAVLADAETIRARARDERLAETVERQIRAADLIALNKCDLVSENAAFETEAWLRERSKGAIVRTTNAGLPLALLRAGVGAAEPPSAGRGPAHAPARLFRSVTVPLESPVNVGALSQALTGLAPSVLRAKGFVRAGEPPGGLRLVELSGSRVTVSEWRDDAGEPPLAMVLIGLADLPDVRTLARRFGATG